MTRLLCFIVMALTWTVGSLAAPAADPANVILDAADVGIALEVEVSEQCSEVHLQWPEALITWRFTDQQEMDGVSIEPISSIERFRVDVTPFPKGLAKGQFKSMNTVRKEAIGTAKKMVVNPTDEAGLMAALTDRLEPAVYYRLRVLAQTSQGWVSSEEIAFMSPVCIADGIDDKLGGDQ